MGFVGRGFDARIAPPLRKSLADVDFDGIVKLVEACPTGALTLKRARVATYEVVARAK
jgi:NADH dehydrogenase/NADH:ubiquinone oxidoreductase subunit G